MKDKHEFFKQRLIEEKGFESDSFKNNIHQL
jgi:hypothetical protein